MNRCGNESDAWLSAHLYVNGWIFHPRCDRVLVEAVGPFLRECEDRSWLSGYFFVRYSESGPHVRLRLRGDPEVLSREVWPALREHVASLYPGVQTGRPEVAPHLGVAADDPARVTHLVQVSYEPEIRRYGGVAATLVAENFFHSSSTAVLQTLPALSSLPPTARLGRGLLAMLILLRLWIQDRTRTEDVAAGYFRGFVRHLPSGETIEPEFRTGLDQQSEVLVEHVREVWARLERGESLSPVLDAYAAAVYVARDSLLALHASGEVIIGERPATSPKHALAAQTASYMHMHNNRLGITRQEEAYLAFLLQHSLRAASVGEMG